MIDKHLHIVCLDVPYPPDYGGVFDLFYKIVSLHNLGVKIHLHCFEYGRGKNTELNNYSVEVNYYKRKTGLQSFSIHLPYIVNSRRGQTLLQNLSKDQHPILLEGIHCTYLLYKNKLQGRKVFVRLHNVEFDYYQQLAKVESSLLKKWYLLYESKLLKKYENEIANKAMMIAVTTKDAETYINEFDAKNIQYLPVFLPYEKVGRKVGKGNFCLYHGNLSIAENEKAATWLLEEVFNDINIPLVIAGKNPSKKLAALVSGNEDACMVSNPTEKHLKDLISKAQINVIPSFNSTGIKIKLLNAIFNGRHSLVNNQAIKGSGLEGACYVEDSVDGFKAALIKLYEQVFTEEETLKRRQLLEETYDNKKNAEQLMQWIW